MCPFLVKRKKKTFIKLNKSLYPKALIDEARRDDPDGFGPLQSKGNYYFFDLKSRELGDYFDFLNLLIYLKKNR